MHVVVEVTKGRKLERPRNSSNFKDNNKKPEIGCKVF